MVSPSVSRTKYVSKSKLSLDNAQSVPYTQDNKYPLPGEGQEGEAFAHAAFPGK